MATSPQPADPPLSLEPVLGWRIWRLVREDGVLTLRSVTRPDGWPPNEPMKAMCSRHRGASIPDQACTCGLYAAATPEDLACSGILSPDSCVVGAIAMWGTVVEHERGARSRFAYPARLRLVCGPCLASGAGAVDPMSVVDANGSLIAVCIRHRLGVRGPARAADRVQAELLSAYCVDLMPIERVARSMRTGPGPLRSNPPELLKVVALAVLSLVKLVLGTLFMIWAYSGLIIFALGLLVGAFNLVTHLLGIGPADAVTSSIAATSPSPVVTRMVVPPKDDLVDRGTLPPPLPPIPASEILCGVGEGDTVTIAPCDRPGSALLGFAERSAPQGPAHDCFGRWDAYSRGNNYWICWADFLDTMSVHRWAHAPNPWSIPVEEGGASHEHR